jgi:hemoglobin
MDSAPAPAEQAPPQTPYELLGGEAALRRLVDRFYDIMDSDPAAATIRAMHAPDLGPMRKSLFAFFSGWMGGPRLYSACVMSAHGKFAIGDRERDEWLACMKRAAEETEMAPELRDAFMAILKRMADGMRNK